MEGSPVTSTLISTLSYIHSEWQQGAVVFKDEREREQGGT